MNSVRYLIMSLLFILVTDAWSQIQPAGVFGDHMVLQQGMPVPVWGLAKRKQHVTVKFNGQTVKTQSDNEGRWKIELTSMASGGPYQLEIGEMVFTDIYVGEVWLCSGQSNMDMTVAREDRYWCGVYHEQDEVAAADYPLIRVFDVPFVPTDTIQKNISAQWEVCSPKTVGHFSATAYFFAREIHKKYNVPIGLITTAYGASTAEAWTSRTTLQSHPQLKFLLTEYTAKSLAYDTSIIAQQKYETAYNGWKAASSNAVASGKEKPREPKNPDPRKDQHSPAVLYNGMVAPLIPFAIKGAIWYQGESNGPTAAIYDLLMEALIKNWRTDWQQGNFPFLFVQLANHQAVVKEPVKDDPMVFVREGQLKNLSIPNTGMVVAIDNANLDDPNDIHPKNKQEIGRRLAVMALGKVYGEKITFSGPLYRDMRIEKDAIRISFKYTGSKLAMKGDSLQGFAIAGGDGNFVRAQAEIDGETVIVSSPEIKDPVAVRYGWSKNPAVNLYNEAGLPASPFRTDDQQ
jgi:sialate O-acetylesterase